MAVWEASTVFSKRPLLVMVRNVPVGAGVRGAAVVRLVMPWVSPATTSSVASLLRRRAACGSVCMSVMGRGTARICECGVINQGDHRDTPTCFEMRTLASSSWMLSSVKA